MSVKVFVLLCVCFESRFFIWFSFCLILAEVSSFGKSRMFPFATHSSQSCLTLSLPSSKSTFSRHLLKKCVSEIELVENWYSINHPSSEWAMKSQALHTVWCYISSEAAGQIWHHSVSYIGCTASVHCIQWSVAFAWGALFCRGQRLMWLLQPLAFFEGRSIFLFISFGFPTTSFHPHFNSSYVHNHNISLCNFSIAASIWAHIHNQEFPVFANRFNLGFRSSVLTFFNLHN